MRLDEPAAPSIGAAPGSLPARTILPFAAERARAAPIEPDPLAAFAAARFLGGRAAPPFAEAFSAETKPPAPTPRQQALRDRLIVTTAAQGAELMRQVAEGVLPAHRAFADFSAALDQTDISAKARAQLRGDFVAGLRKAERSRGPERVTPPLREAGASDPFPDDPSDQVPSLESAVTVDRAGKGDKLPIRDREFARIADRIGEFRAALNRDFGNGSISDTAELFGGVVDDEVRGFLESIPLFGEQLVAGRDELGATFAEGFGRLAEYSGKIALHVARRNGLSEEQADNVRWLAERLIFLPLSAFGGKFIKRRRSRPRTPSTHSVGDIGSTGSDATAARIARREAVPRDTASPELRPQNLNDRIPKAEDPRSAIAQTAFGQVQRNGWTQFTNFRQLFDGTIPGTSSKLRTNMLKDKSLGLEKFTGWQAHHIIPRSFWDEKIIMHLKFNIDHPNNGIALPDTVAGQLSVHAGFHKEYNGAFERFLTRLARSNAPDLDKVAILGETIERVRGRLAGGNPPLMTYRGATSENWNKVLGKIGDELGLPPIVTE